MGGGDDRHRTRGGRIFLGKAIDGIWTDLGAGMRAQAIR